MFTAFLFPSHELIRGIGTDVELTKLPTQKGHKVVNGKGRISIKSIQLVSEAERIKLEFQERQRKKGARAL